MNMHRISTLDETPVTDYNVGAALAAEGRPVSHVDTAEQEIGYVDYLDDDEFFDGIDAYLTDMQDAGIDPASYDHVIDDAVAKHYNDGVSDEDIRTDALWDTLPRGW